MPTSITTAPGLTKSRSISRARPTAAISTSARAQTARRSRVREWQIVTVAFSASSSCAIGLPNRFERPTTTASAPSSSTPVSREQLHHARAACTGAARAGRATSRPALTGVSPSTSLSGIDHRRQRRPVEVRRARGSCSRMPLTARSALSALELLGDLLERRVAPAGAGRTAVMPTSAQARCLPPT